MSDLIAPTTTAFWDPERRQRTLEDPVGQKLVALLTDIRTELRILTAAVHVGLNVKDDSSRARQDPDVTGNFPPSAYS